MKPSKMVLPVVMGIALLAAPAMAKQQPAQCSKVRAALDSGKTQQQVAKDLKTSIAHVKQCTMDPQAKAK